ncbi:MAG: ferrous iron transporter B [Myxococcales bacterium]|nr:ferrous iron transporter B [Myxococcales bacterium]
MTETAIVTLVGRPNAGKSSLFNAVTGAHAKVGNFPGVTVDVLEAQVPVSESEAVRFVDLPGVYTVEGDTDPESDEGHARRFLEEFSHHQTPAVIAQVLDATQLALGLRLTLELRRRGLPLVVLATQHDALIAQGFELDAAGLSEALGVPVVATSAREVTVRARVLEVTAEAARLKEVPPTDTIDVEALAKRVLRPRVDAKEAFARVRARTERLDAVLLHPLLGPVFFLAFMTALFSAVFFIAEPVTGLIDLLNQALGARIEGALGTGWVSSLLVDGVLGGAGTVLAFLPQIVILTVALELIDASGYLARGTFLVDRLLRFAGLGGRSFVPLLSAHACAVPAISSARIIRDPGQRLRTILVLPLMTCSARIPTYGLLITTFFAAKSVWFRGGLFVALYFAGLGFGLIASLVLGRTVKRTSQPLPLVLELPPYRVPQVAVVARVGWRAATRFVRDVGSVILIAAVVLWALLTVPGPSAGTPPPEATPRVVAMYGSLAASVGRALEPVTTPAGFDWRLNVGLIGSLGARELMVGTLGVIFGIEDTGDDPAPLADRLRDARRADGTTAYGMATALSLMVFFVLACQCISTLAAVRRETRSWRWPLFVFVYTYGAAWVLSVVVYQLASAAGL